jgi:hypothetical protein
MAEPVKAETAKPVNFSPPPRPKTLQIGSLQVAEHKRNLWVGEADSDISIAEMLKPEFWVHDARRLRPRDEVEVWAKDGSWLEVMIVRSVLLPEIGRPVVKVLRKDDIPRSDDAAPEIKNVNGLIVKWRGPQSKWAVIRESDKEVIKDKFEVREDAEAYLNEFSRAA